MTDNSDNIVLCISGPSGVGKGTVINSLMKDFDFKLSISMTARKPRGEEKMEWNIICDKEKFKV